MQFGYKSFNTFYYLENFKSTNAVIGDWLIRDTALNKFFFFYTVIFLELHNSDFNLNNTVKERSFLNTRYVTYNINSFFSKYTNPLDAFFWNLIRLIKIKHISAFNVKKGLPFTSKRTHFGNKNSRKTLTFLKDFMPKKENNIRLIVNAYSYTWR